jgi:Fe-S oxidoreductase
METPEISTLLDFSKDGGILRAAERCNGSGDCRKTELAGGTMCPSYMASRDEYTTTRARANLLREYLTEAGNGNAFDRKELYEILDLCLSCKGCKSECPSNVDMAKLKAEFLFQYQKNHGVPLRSRMIANISRINALFSPLPGLFNILGSKNPVSYLAKKMLGFATERSIPVLSRQTFNHWFHKKEDAQSTETDESRQLILFNDEFTNFNDVETGKKTVELLVALGYRVRGSNYIQSGRSFISKGLLGKARHYAEKNVLQYRNVVSEKLPLVGIEPSAILSFRDEYPELVDRKLADDARRLSENVLTIEEFLAREYDAGRIDEKLFTTEHQKISLHGHCQQKAIASTADTIKVLSIPSNYIVEEIPSGCCGMAGSFGYEKEHYDLSMKVGELVLFPAIRNLTKDVIVAAPGTSCRHQIKDGTGRKALHPVEVLFDALVR